MNDERVNRLRRKKWLFLIIFFILFFWWFSIKPSNNRNWTTDQAVLPYAEINGNLVAIKNIRNFDYRSTAEYTPRYYDATFDLSKLKQMYYVVEPFSRKKGAAHTLVSFEFEDDRFIALSVEIRKEKGEKFSAWKGLFKRYELMYVAADERDVIKLRSNYRKDKVYVYPVKGDLEKKKEVFLTMVNRMSKLKEEPEFYNTLRSNCTTNIRDAVNKISPRKIPWSIDLLLPANSDRLAYDLGLIDTDLSLEEAREKFLINDRAQKFADSPDFSVKIRQ